jgi:hypothetical protein
MNYDEAIIELEELNSHCGELWYPVYTDAINSTIQALEKLKVIEEASVELPEKKQYDFHPIHASFVVFNTSENVKNHENEIIRIKGECQGFNECHDMFTPIVQKLQLENAELRKELEELRNKEEFIKRHRKIAFENATKRIIELFKEK